MEVNIFHLLPQICALRQRVLSFEKALQKEFGFVLKLNVAGADAAIGIDAIVKIVSNTLSIPMNKIMSNERSTNTKEARQLAMFLCKKYISKVTDREIAAYFSKDRSNIIHSLNRINALIDSNDENIVSFLRACETVLQNQIKMQYHDSDPYLYEVK